MITNSNVDHSNNKNHIMSPPHVKQHTIYKMIDIIEFDVQGTAVITVVNWFVGQFEQRSHRGFL